MNFTIHQATASDFDFLSWIDRVVGGQREQDDERLDWLRQFVDADTHVAWLGTRDERETPAGVIMVVFHDLNAQTQQPGIDHLFESVGRALIAPNGRFGEVFELWVAADCRRQGLATALKNEFEREARARNMDTLYTHTEVTNPHVVEMNVKLGYREVRRGLLGKVERVSLMKDLRV